MIAMALVQIANQLVWHGRAVVIGEWNVEKHLPCHLCDAATIASIVVLLRPSPAIFELSYFWGLGGAVQALLTPDITDGFPHYFYWQFFLTHGGLVLAPVLLVSGLDMRIQRGAVLRIFLRSNAFMLLAAITNELTGANYMFLRNPPPTGSLLDHLGPWPWYIVSGEFVGLAIFFLLALPFRWSSRTGVTARAAKQQPQPLEWQTSKRLGQ
jgi:hypothetical integral membrane protein (TIGR02206 family)